MELERIERGRGGNLGIIERRLVGSLGFRERKGRETWALVRGRGMDLLV
jgi:hypothetical protein